VADRSGKVSQIAVFLLRPELATGPGDQLAPRASVFGDLLGASVEGWRLAASFTTLARGTYFETTAGYDAGGGSEIES
jgi:hypothetical protein